MCLSSLGGSLQPFLSTYVTRCSLAKHPIFSLQQGIRDGPERMIRADPLWRPTSAPPPALPGAMRREQSSGRWSSGNETEASLNRFLPELLFGCGKAKGGKVFLQVFAASLQLLMRLDLSPRAASHTIRSLGLRRWSMSSPQPRMGVCV